MAKYIFIVYARDGDYDEKRWMLVSGWPTRKSATGSARTRCRGRATGGVHTCATSQPHLRRRNDDPRH